MPKAMGNPETGQETHPSSTLGHAREMVRILRQIHSRSISHNIILISQLDNTSIRSTKPL